MVIPAHSVTGPTRTSPKPCGSGFFPPHGRRYANHSILEGRTFTAVSHVERHAVPSHGKGIQRPGARSWRLKGQRLHHEQYCAKPHGPCNAARYARLKNERRGPVRRMGIMPRLAVPIHHALLIANDGPACFAVAPSTRSGRSRRPAMSSQWKYRDGRPPGKRTSKLPNRGRLRGQRCECARVNLMADYAGACHRAAPCADPVGQSALH
jgi:hypothetical protein